MPPADLYQTWDMGTKTEFQTFRRDIQFFVLSAYTVVGHGLFNDFVAYGLACAKEEEWSGLEAALFCLNGIAESVSELQQADSSLTVLFSSPIFGSIRAGSGSNMDFKTQQTIVSLIGNYAPYFERNPSNLQATISFLFSTLENRALINVSAKTIHKLCSSCRNNLKDSAANLTRHFRVLILQGLLPYSVKEKIASAIAAIIQAIGNQSALPATNGHYHDDSANTAMLQSVSDFELIEWGNSLIREVVRHPIEELIRSDGPILNLNPAPYFLHHILDTLCLDLQAQWTTSNEGDQAIGAGILSCIVSIGRAFRSPEDGVVDVDAKTPAHSIWQSQAGQRVQQRILEICSLLLSQFEADGEITELVCQTLRTGFTETDGPFVFPLAATESMFYAIGSTTTRVGVVLETVGVLLRKHMPNYFDEAHSGITNFSISCLKKALQLIQERIQGLPL